MRQQINLYQPTISDARRPLSAASVAVGVGLLTACLAGISLYASQRVAGLERAVEELRVQQTAQQQQLARTTELAGKRASPSALEARLQQLSVTLGERERALELLQSGAAGQTTGFAARLEALARRHVAGLWLDSVRLSGTNPAMSLQGATTNPDMVPLYLQSLADDPVLAGTRFDQFVLHRPELEDAGSRTGSAASPSPVPDAAVLRFSAGNAALPAAKEGNQP
jgi:hypothetical protein